MTEAQIKRIAEQAAEAAVEKTLLRLGIDPESPNAFEDRRLDFEYLRRLRVGSDIFKRQGITVVAGVVTTFIIGAIVAAFLKWRPY